MEWGRYKRSRDKEKSILFDMIKTEEREEK